MILTHTLKLLTLTLALSLLSACQTAQGFGKDIQAGGQAIQSAAGG